MTDKQPVVIRSGAFVCTIYDVENLMALPLANVRKLWKIMLVADDENRETIQMIRDWLPQTRLDAEGVMHVEQARLRHVVGYANALHSKMAAFGSLITKEQRAELKDASSVLRYAEKQLRDAKERYEHLQKLQTLFHNLTTN